MFVGMEQKTVLNELQRERNNDIITSFASDYSLRFVILQKITEKEVRLELEWTPDMLTTCNILFIKRNNFNIYKDITTFKIAEMLQVNHKKLRSLTWTSKMSQMSSPCPINTSISF